MSNKTPITVAYGDGIGPEIMESTLSILDAAGAHIDPHVIELGEKLYLKNYSSGIAPETWDVINKNKILLKAPITTPQGGGYKSLNVTLRKTLGLYANIRPAISYDPFVHCRHPELDVVIVRENEEDLYAGIEYRHTHNIRESIKLISRTGCEKIIRYAFEYAIRNNRKKVTCFSKDNIMKFSDGIFHKTFDEIAKEYPNIENDHYIVDIGTARLATQPELFDIIVTSNLFGDIISDITAEISGSVGLAGSANIGKNFAMFEAIHGSAPTIADQNIANPSGLLNAAIMMLVNINKGEVANKIENAWKKTIEDGIHTADIYNPDISKSKVGTKEFTNAVIERLNQTPCTLSVAQYKSEGDDEKDTKNFQYKIDKGETKKLVGVDVFVSIHTTSVNNIAQHINGAINSKTLQMKTISSKGLKLWPNNTEKLVDSDHWCCRFFAKDDVELIHGDIAHLLQELSKANIDFIKVENLYHFDDQRGYSLAQGE